MKGTKLWQAPGSPIIQGRSRMQRPFWEVWVAGALWAEVLVIASAGGWGMRSAGASFVDAFGSAFAGVLIPSVPGAMLGAAVGVRIARVVGWRRPWLAGLVFGALAGWGTALLLARPA